MEKLQPTVNIFLRPGECYFGDRNDRIRTLLGSCVAMTMWHPELLVGGMSHCMLPSRPRRSSDALDGKYADEALALLLNKALLIGTRAEDYQFKLFGGGDMFPTTAKSNENPVGLKNVKASQALLKHHGFKAHAEHLGGTGHRTLIFEICNGHVWVKHQSAPPPGDGNSEGKHPCPPA